MIDGKTGSLCSQSKEMVCIDTYRVLDSCRDKDCFEDMKVYLTNFGKEIIERTSAVRTKWAKVVSAYIDVDKVPFNCGFYQLTIKIFVKLIFEACLGAGNIQEFEGITVLEKKVVLFGGEGNVSVFKSGCGCSAFCPDHENSCEKGDKLPIAVIETVDPVILDTKVSETPRCCQCACCCSDIPEHVTRYVGGCLSEYDNGMVLTVSLGLFSVVRIQRPAQLLVNAAEYSVPEKECIEAKDNDPCSVFRGMPFPVCEFGGTKESAHHQKNPGCSCGC